jgi:hypothetical protein
MTMFRRFLCAILIGCITLQGCSLFSPSMQTLTVSTSDPAAEIYINGSYIGKGSASLSLAKNRAHTVRAALGKRESVQVVGYHISATGILDIIGGVLFLLPLLGLLGPGFFTLDLEHVHMAIPSE